MNNNNNNSKCENTNKKKKKLKKKKQQEWDIDSENDCIEMETCVCSLFLFSLYIQYIIFIIFLLLLIIHLMIYIENNTQSSFSMKNFKSRMIHTIQSTKPRFLKISKQFI